MKYDHPFCMCQKKMQSVEPSGGFLRSTDHPRSAFPTPRQSKTNMVRTEIQKRRRETNYSTRFSNVPTSSGQKGENPYSNNGVIKVTN